MNTQSIIQQINDLLLQIPADSPVCLLDEDGNESNLRLDYLELNQDNDIILGWCHSYFN